MVINEVLLILFKYSSFISVDTITERVILAKSTSNGSNTTWHGQAWYDPELSFFSPIFQCFFHTNTHSDLKI